MDDRLKELMQDLGNAINESLSDSDRIGEAIHNIKLAGYDIFLVLEVTIGFNKREDGQEGVDLPADPPAESNIGDDKVKWTSQDHKFMRALKIAVDEDNQQ